MSKFFRSWDVDQSLLLPPSVHDFVPEGHLSRFVVKLVSETLDLSEIYASYQGELGQPPYHPGMMTALLLYGYGSGIYSSRRLSKACGERTDFMVVTGLSRPNFRTISEFRRRHLEALGRLFVQVLRLCQEAGLVKLGHVALDGTKVKANASKHKAMSYGRMAKKEEELGAEVAAWFEAAAAVDGEEDAAFGSDKRGDELPDWVKDKQRRLEKIAEAKAALEAEAKAAGEAKAKAKAGSEAKAKAEGRHKPSGGRKPKTPPGEPKASAQRNFTDPESAIMKSKEGFIQGYNAQAAVDSKAQVIVAQGLTANASDQGQLVALVDQIKPNTGRKPRELSADAGYCLDDNLAALEDRSIRGYVATGRAKKPADGKAKSARTRIEAMRKRLRRGGRRSRYRLRKQVVEPVFGQIKQARGFRQFLLRGIDKASAEWAMICTAHNLLKLAKAA
jgi:transposase